MTARAIWLTVAAAALVGCASNSVGPTPAGPPVVTPASLPTVSLPTIEPILLEPPSPPPPDCDPEDYHFLGWRMRVTPLQGGVASVHATPTWGRRGAGTSTPIPGPCLDAWVGSAGPEWRGDVPGAPEPGDPYRFNATGHGRLWVCTRTTGDCVDVVV